MFMNNSLLMLGTTQETGLLIQHVTDIMWSITIDQTWPGNKLGTPDDHMSNALNWKLYILAVNYFNVLVKVVTIGGYELISQLYTYGKVLVTGWMVYAFSLTGFVLIQG